MAIRKNTKRIDPRYFLHETAYRDEIEEEVDPNDPGPDACKSIETMRGTYKPENPEERALAIKCQMYYPTERACKNLLGATGNYKPENPEELAIAKKCDSQHPHLTQSKSKGMLDKIKGAFRE